MLAPPFGDLTKFFVGQYLHDVLGEMPKTSRLIMRKAGCGCADCQVLDDFLMGPLARTVLRLPVTRKSHIEKRVLNIPDLVSYTIVKSGSPHGIQIIKAAEFVSNTHWGSKVDEANKFLEKLGDTALLEKLMGHRYPDIEPALNGKQKFLLPFNRPSTCEPSAILSLESTIGIKRKAADDLDEESSALGVKRKST